MNESLHFKGILEIEKKIIKLNNCNNFIFRVWVTVSCVNVKNLLLKF